jgi:hypothetical protein
MPARRRSSRATVADLLPAQLSGATWTCAASAGSACPASGSRVTSARRSICRAAAPRPSPSPRPSTGTGTITNTATVAAPVGVNDPAGNNSATDGNTVVAPTSDLSITKTDGLANITQNGTVTYTIVASNAGPSRRSSVRR